MTVVQRHELNDLLEKKAEYLGMWWYYDYHFHYSFFYRAACMKKDTFSKEKFESVRNITSPSADEKHD